MTDKEQFKQYDLTMGDVSIALARLLDKLTEIEQLVRELTEREISKLGH